MAALTFTVATADTAIALGSGDVDVLATPRLLAWLEAATVACVEPLLTEGATSVGTRIELEHLLPARVGATVTASAELVSRDGRLVRLRAVAEDASGRLLATATVTRVVVDRERFRARVAE